MPFGVVGKVAGYCEFQTCFQATETKLFVITIMTIKTEFHTLVSDHLMGISGYFTEQ